MQSRRDFEEKQLADLLAAYQSEGIVVYGQIESLPGTYAKILVKSDGTVKVEGVVSGSLDITDDWTRQLGQVDIARYLGTAIGVSNPLHSQIVVSGAVIDPRSIRALVKTTDELYSVLRTDAGVAYDARQIRSLISTDIITAYGSLGALQQRASTYDLLVALRQAGSELSASNPIFAGIVDSSANRMPSMDASTRPGYVDMIDRAARLLGIAYGSQAQQLLQRATTYDLIVQVRSAGVEIDPRQVLGSQSQQLLQRASTYDLIVQLRQAGTEIDPRLIQDIQKVVTPTYLNPIALGIGETHDIVAAPGSGYKLRLKGIQISVDAATRIDLRWATTPWRSYYLPANGSIERNFIGENIEGGNNQALTLLSSAAATVTASATTETLVA